MTMLVDSPIEPVVNHRRAHRLRTLREAKAILSDATLVDCIVRDLNDGGAHIVFGEAFALPLDFRLLFVAKNRMTPARVCWQRGRHVGVAFTGPEEAAPRRV